jgi:hypothetical protein
MKHVVSFSGGVCSFWAAARVIEEHGPANVTLLFADTKMEDEDLYRFNEEASAHLGVALTVTVDGRTPWEIFFDEQFLGNSRIDPCSRLLKRERLWRWTRENCDRATTVNYVGLDWTEGHRLARLRAARPDWRIEAPMLAGELWDKTRMFRELAAIGVEIPRLYKLGFPHNNCGGFCIKAGQAHFAHLLRVLPDRYAFHEGMEEMVRAKLGDVSILNRVVGGIAQRLTLRQLRQEIEGGREYDRLEWGGCGCAVDETEQQGTFL